MCISAPGKVISITDDMAVVDYDGEQRDASTRLVDVKIGDWVLVNAKFIIDKLDPDVAKKSLDMWKKALQDES